MINGSSQQVAALSPGYPYEEILRTIHKQNDNAMCSYLPVFNSFNFTKGGLTQLNHGGPQPLQYVVSAAFVASLYADYLDTADTPGWYCGPNFYTTQVLRDFAMSQLHYILGKNPLKMSYVVVFGNKYPKRVHHRGASIPHDGVKYGCEGGFKWRDSKKANPNILIGEMVACPDRHAGFKDVRTNYNYTKPTLAANAGLVAALISLADIGTAKSTGIDKKTQSSQQFPQCSQPLHHHHQHGNPEEPDLSTFPRCQWNKWLFGTQQRPQTESREHKLSELLCQYQHDGSV